MKGRKNPLEHASEWSERCEKFRWNLVLKGSDLIIERVQLQVEQEWAQQRDHGDLSIHPLLIIRLLHQEQEEKLVIYYLIN
jgi:hypothetical protein